MFKRAWRHHGIVIALAILVHSCVLLRGLSAAGLEAAVTVSQRDLVAIAPEVVEPTAAELAEMAGGEVLRRHDESGSSGGEAAVQALMNASAADVWNVIVSCEAAMVYVDGIEYCEVLASETHYARTRQIVDRGWSSPRLDFVFEAERSPHRYMIFNLVEGNLEEMRGYWRFDDTGQGLLVSYAIELRPKTPAPGWLVRRIMARGMVDLLACIRGLADGSMSEQARSHDLQACPGDPGSLLGDVDGSDLR